MTKIKQEQEQINYFLTSSSLPEFPQNGILCATSNFRKLIDRISAQGALVVSGVYIDMGTHQDSSWAHIVPRTSISFVHVEMVLDEGVP